MTEALTGVYGGADLHGRNVVLSVCDEEGELLWERRVKGELDRVVEVLEPYRDRLRCLTVESTYNWYWFVDGLQDHEVPVRMANPARLDSYSGVKETNDFTDARWLAELGRLKVVPESYVYPRGPRALRDLLRRRMLMVRQRTGLQNSLAAWRARHAVRSQATRSGAEVERLELDRYVRLEAQMLLKGIARLGAVVGEIEKEVLQVVGSTLNYQQLLVLPGVGRILAMTIVLESGEFSRFRSSAHYASYCRTVRSRRTSNGKNKGQNNARNGNPHLAWAFSEAAHFMVRYDERARRWFERKKKRSNEPIAYKALACKLAKAVWHIMQGEPYQPERLFG
jgi:transposase